MFAFSIYYWEPALYREVCNLRSVRNEDAARQREDGVYTPLARSLEYALNILAISYL